MNTTLHQDQQILVVDDHVTVRDGLRFQISRHAGLSVCGEASSIAAGLRLYKELSPDLAIIDISLEDGLGIDLIKKIKAHDNNARLLVLSMYNESLYAERALRAGAMGYLNKQESRDQLIAAVRQVLQGERYLSPELTKRLIGQAVGRIDERHSSPVDALTNRELEVFQLIGAGMTTGAIARKLFLSPHTIDTHREKIKNKLGLKNGGELQREAVQWVLENG